VKQSWWYQNYYVVDAWLEVIMRTSIVVEEAFSMPPMFPKQGLQVHVVQTMKLTTIL